MNVPTIFLWSAMERSHSEVAEFLMVVEHSVLWYCVGQSRAFSRVDIRRIDLNHNGRALLICWSCTWQLFILHDFPKGLGSHPRFLCKEGSKSVKCLFDGHKKTPYFLDPIALFKDKMPIPVKRWFHQQKEKGVVAVLRPSTEHLTCRVPAVKLLHL